MSQPNAIAPDLTSSDYLVVGLSTCYVKVDGEVKEITVCEPVPSAYLEALLKGVPTSYRSLYGSTLGEVIVNGSPQAPSVLATGHSDLTIQIAQNFVERSIAAARTYQSRPNAQALIPLGTRFNEVNYSTEKKRVLNQQHVVSNEDNVKQHQYTHMTL
jgi:hypothetical protein